MRARFWRWLGRLADLLGASQPAVEFAKRHAEGIVWGSVMTAAASSIQWLSKLGWGVVFIVGVLLASSALALYRYFKPLPPEPQAETGRSPDEAATSLGRDAENPASDRPAKASEPASGSSISDRSIYVGRVLVDTGSLATECRLDFGFRVFNGSGLPWKVRGFRGVIRFACATDSSNSDLIGLPPPELRQGLGMDLRLFTEEAIAISQALREQDAAMIAEVLARGDRVMFVFEALDIELARDGSNGRMRLNVWDRVTCQRMESMPAVMQNHMGSARLSVLGARG
jgi:hypothetical protein